LPFPNPNSFKHLHLCKCLGQDHTPSPISLLSFKIHILLPILQELSLSSVLLPKITYKIPQPDLTIASFV
jgi:hypothetical protein